MYRKLTAIGTGKQIASSDLTLTITVPKNFNSYGSNKFLKLRDWLSSPIGEGSNPGTF